MSRSDSAVGPGGAREQAQAEEPQEQRLPGPRETLFHLTKDQRDEGDSLEMLRAVLSRGTVIPKAMPAKPPAAKARSREPTAEEQGLMRELHWRVVELQQCVQTKQWEKWELALFKDNGEPDDWAVNMRDAYEVEIKELERERKETHRPPQNTDRAIDMGVQHR